MFHTLAILAVLLFTAPLRPDTSNNPESRAQDDQSTTLSTFWVETDDFNTPQFGYDPSEKQAEYRQEPVRVASLPPKDNYDWAAYWAGVLLAFVGIVGVGVGVCTLRLIVRQTGEMRLQRIAMHNTLGAIKRQADLMKEQAEHMEAQTAILRDSVAVAQHSADVARATLNAAIAKDRARLRVDFSTGLQVSTAQVQGEASVIIATKLGLSHHGTTEASINYSEGEMLLTNSEEPEPDLFPPTLTLPSGTITSHTDLSRVGLQRVLSQSDMREVTAKRKFLHIYGSIQYRDLFSPEIRETSFYCVWQANAAEPSRSQWHRRECVGYNEET